MPHHHAVLAFALCTLVLTGPLLHGALHRRRATRRRLHERQQGTGRYDTGCPALITRADVDAAEAAHLREKYPAHAAAGYALAQLEETLVQTHRALTGGHEIRRKETSNA